jgi:hypothetical protein
VGGPALVEQELKEKEWPRIKTGVLINVIEKPWNEILARM